MDTQKAKETLQDLEGKTDSILTRLVQSPYTVVIVGIAVIIGLIAWAVFR
jgi:hypothetical protein